MAENTVLGLTLAKINGTFWVDVTNTRWSTKRAIQAHVTGGGIRIAKGQPMPTGSCDAVVPKSKELNLAALSNFKIEVYDRETQSIIVMAHEGCEWGNLDGSSDESAANTKKSFGWTATKDLLAPNG